MKQEKHFPIDIWDSEAVELQEEMNKMEKEQLKKAVLQRMECEGMKKKGTHKWKTWKAAAAAAVALAVVTPTSIFAANKIYEHFHSQVTQNGYGLDMDIQQETSAPEKKVKPMKLVCDTPDGYTIKNEEDGYYYFEHKKGYEAGKEFELELIQIDQDFEKETFVKDVSYKEEITINGQKAVYIQLNDLVGSSYSKDTEYSQRVLVFYEDAGYMMQFYGMKGLEKDTLLEYISGISIEETTKKKASTYMTLSEYLTHHPIRTEEEEEAAEKSYEIATSISKEDVIAPGETATFDGVEYQVQNVEVLDNISDLIKDNGKGVCDAMGIWERRLEFSEEDGTLKSYVREEITEGDGKNEPYGKVSAKKEVAQKFVTIELRMKNTTKEKKESVQVCLDMNFIQEKNGTFEEVVTSYSRPGIIDDCQIDCTAQYFKETDGGKGFYLKDLKPGEEQVYHIGYFVDEDMVDQMMLCVDGGGYDRVSSMYKLDIRQKVE